MKRAEQVGQGKSRRFAPRGIVVCWEHFASTMMESDLEGKGRGISWEEHIPEETDLTIRSSTFSSGGSDSLMKILKPVCGVVLYLLGTYLYQRGRGCLQYVSKMCESSVETPQGPFY